VLEGGSAGGASAYVGFGMALRDIWTYCAVIVRERCWKCLGILVDSRLSADVLSVLFPGRCPRAVPV